MGICDRMMRLFGMVLLLIYVSVPIDGQSNDSDSFAVRIRTAEDEIRSLCSHIEEKTLKEATTFKRLMGDAHLHCPDHTTMDTILAKVDIMAGEHSISVKKQLDSCQELLRMLASGLESGDLVVHYLKEGNYSLVTSMIDKWHESFTKFRATYFVAGLPVERMFANSKVFYEDRLTRGLGRFLLTWTIIFSLSYVGALLVRSLFARSARQSPVEHGGQSKGSNHVHTLSSQTQQNNEDHLGLVRRMGIHGTAPPSQGDRSDSSSPGGHTNNRSNAEASAVVSTPSKTSSLSIWIVVFSLLAGAALIWIPSSSSLTTGARCSWYPDATSALISMKADMDNQQANVACQIKSIEELQNYASMYQDETVQTMVNDLVSSLVRGVRQAHMEVSEAYRSSTKLSTTFLRTYERIEAAAKKTGKEEETKDLLIQLKKGADEHATLQRNLQVSIIGQQNTLPILKEQVTSMQELLKQDRLIDLGRVIGEHKEITMTIGENTYKVEVSLEHVISTVNNEDRSGMKQLAESLSEDSVKDQAKATLEGRIAVAGGAVATTGLAFFALKTGLAMATITCTAVAGPILLSAGGVGAAGVTLKYVYNRWDDVTLASKFEQELAALETERVNLKVALEKLQQAVADQRTSLESTENSLMRLEEHIHRFSNIRGFILNVQQRRAINEELQNLKMQYTKIMAVSSLFQQGPHKNNKALPQS